MHEIQTSIKNFYEFVDFTIKCLDEFTENCIAYSNKTEKLGFKKLLLSLIEQGREHLRRLKELKQQGNMDFIFPNVELTNFNINEYACEMEYFSDIGYLDFLTYIIQKTEATSKLYNYLMSHSKNQDAASLFKRLFDDVKKHRAVVQDRYELEIINMT